MRPEPEAAEADPVTDVAPGTEEQCPKRMMYGPCGGVRADLTCEMQPAKVCPFTGRGLVRWVDAAVTSERSAFAAAMHDVGAGPAGTDAGSLLTRAATRPVVLTDFTVRAYDPVSVAEVTRELAGSCDAVLVGEHHNRPDFPPSLLLPMIRENGCRAWITLTCRDRNRIVLEQELAGLSAQGCDGVLCVTGDGRGVGVRPDVTSVFDLDSTRLAALAHAVGIPTAVAESPEAPPASLRPSRLREKERAGAQVCFLNHVSSPARLRTFVEDARSAGCTLPFVAGVAVYTDERSARVLQGFPGLHLDPVRVDAVLSAADPVRAGIDEAVREARALLEIPGVIGVNLSGLASSEGERSAAAIKAVVGREVRGT